MHDDPKILRRAYWSEPLAWLLRESGGLLGETSNMSSVVSALQSGGAGKTVASSDDHHDHLIARLDHVERARDLDRIWAKVSHESQWVLRVYYEPRACWPLGCQAHLGPDLASVALAFAEDRPGLLEACRNASKTSHKGIIEDAKTKALALIAEAHEAWDEARKQDLRRAKPTANDFMARAQALRALYA